MNSLLLLHGQWQAALAHSLVLHCYPSRQRPTLSQAPLTLLQRTGAQPGTASTGEGVCSSSRRVMRKGWGPAVEDRRWQRIYRRQQRLDLLQKVLRIAELRYIF